MALSAPPISSPMMTPAPKHQNLASPAVVCSYCEKAPRASTLVSALKCKICSSPIHHSCATKYRISSESPRCRQCNKEQSKSGPRNSPNLQQPGDTLQVRSAGANNVTGGSTSPPGARTNTKSSRNSNSARSVSSRGPSASALSPTTGTPAHDKSTIGVTCGGRITKTRRGVLSTAARASGAPQKELDPRRDIDEARVAATKGLLTTTPSSLEKNCPSQGTPTKISIEGVHRIEEIIAGAYSSSLPESAIELFGRRFDMIEGAIAELKSLIISNNNKNSDNNSTPSLRTILDESLQEQRKKNKETQLLPLHEPSASLVNNAKNISNFNLDLDLDSSNSANRTTGALVHEKISSLQEKILEQSRLIKNLIDEQALLIKNNKQLVEQCTFLRECTMKKQDAEPQTGSSQRPAPTSPSPGIISDTDAGGAEDSVGETGGVEVGNCELIIKGLTNDPDSFSSSETLAIAHSVLASISPLIQKEDIRGVRWFRSRVLTGGATETSSLRRVERAPCCVVALAGREPVQRVVRAKRELRNLVLSTRDIRTGLLGGDLLARLPDRRIYISEMLPKEAFLMFKNLKPVAKRLGFRYVWHAGGRFLVRRRSGAKAHTFRTAADLGVIAESYSRDRRSSGRRSPSSSPSRGTGNSPRTTTS